MALKWNVTCRRMGKSDSIIMTVPRIVAKNMDMKPNDVVTWEVQDSPPIITIRVPQK